MTILIILALIRKHPQAVVLPLLIGLTMLLTIGGCGTYNEYATRPAVTPQPACDPCPAPRQRPQANLIFDRGIVRSQIDYVDPQQFSRAEWPLAERPYGPVTVYERTHYREYRFSDQYIEGNNEARLRFHNRIRGYREVEVVR